MLYNSIAYSTKLKKIVYFNKDNTGKVSVRVGGTPQSIPVENLDFDTDIDFVNVPIETIDRIANKTL